MDANYFNFYNSKSVPNGEEELLVYHVFEVKLLGADKLLSLKHIWPTGYPYKKGV